MSLFDKTNSHRGANWEEGGQSIFGIIMYILGAFTMSVILCLGELQIALCTTDVCYYLLMPKRNSFLLSSGYKWSTKDSKLVEFTMSIT